jgi:Cu+-exporting ATPase
LLELAGAAESGSEHPIASAIVDGARARVGSVPTPESFLSAQGLGVQAVVDGHLVQVGRPRWLAEQWQVVLPVALETERAAFENLGRTVVAVAWDGEARGILAVSDTVKPTSAAAIAHFRALGLRPILLTGDNERVAKAVAHEVGGCRPSAAERGSRGRDGR